ncbi:MAG: ATP-binding cassette subfamily F protein 3 [Candidatus Saccharimonadales bacterium]|jgi:ATP-binding cassette subfamily F protein 3
MIAHIQIHEKSFANLKLYNGLDFRINAGEKIGLLGRNGTGKTTLFNMISGEDLDYDGDIDMRKGLVVISTRQEHQDKENEDVLEYILGDLPEFAKLKHAIDTLPEQMDNKKHLMQQYSDALERFGVLGYYEVESEVIQALEKYQLPEEKATNKLSHLSGGQKRLVELVKVQRARADLALIDEPTNHMDYVMKDSFLDWMKRTKEAVVVISHDRDVLKAVDKIIEIRDGKADICKGNYDDYLRINTTRMTSEVNEFEITQSRITNLQSDVVRFQRLKEKARSPGTISRFKSQEQKARTELAKLQSKEKPSFWIDQDSAKGLKTKLAEAYDEHKTRNIKIRTTSKPSSSNTLLVELDKLSLGYDKPLFDDISVQLREGDRLRVHGRNGVGKSTLVQAIIDSNAGKNLKSEVYAGTIYNDQTTFIGVYEQELDPSYLKLTLSEAIEQAYDAKGLSCTNQLVKSLLNDYLFNPSVDGDKPIEILSGGQKARFQLINMLAGNPNVLILDEPTNHLDLPSIEELEQALAQYHGAIIYISHDSYFTNKMLGKEIHIKESENIS